MKIGNFDIDKKEASIQAKVDAIKALTDALLLRYPGLPLDVVSHLMIVTAEYEHLANYSQIRTDSLKDSIQMLHRMRKACSTLKSLVEVNPTHN